MSSMWHQRLTRNSSTSPAPDSDIVRIPPLKWRPSSGQPSKPRSSNIPEATRSPPRTGTASRLPRPSGKTPPRLSTKASPPTTAEPPRRQDAHALPIRQNAHPMPTRHGSLARSTASTRSKIAHLSPTAARIRKGKAELASLNARLSEMDAQYAKVQAELESQIHQSLAGPYTDPYAIGLQEEEPESWPLDSRSSWPLLNLSHLEKGGNGERMGTFDLNEIMEPATPIETIPPSISERLQVGRVSRCHNSTSVYAHDDVAEKGSAGPKDSVVTTPQQTDEAAADGDYTDDDSSSQCETDGILGGSTNASTDDFSSMTTTTYSKQWRHRNSSMLLSSSCSPRPDSSAVLEAVTTTVHTAKHQAIAMVDIQKPRGPFSNRSPPACPAPLRPALSRPMARSGGDWAFMLSDSVPRRIPENEAVLNMEDHRRTLRLTYPHQQSHMMQKPRMSSLPPSAPESKIPTVPHYVPRRQAPSPSPAPARRVDSIAESSEPRTPALRLFPDTSSGSQTPASDALADPFVVAPAPEERDEDKAVALQEPQNPRQKAFSAVRRLLQPAPQTASRVPSPNKRGKRFSTSAQFKARERRVRVWLKRLTNRTDKSRQTENTASSASSSKDVVKARTPLPSRLPTYRASILDLEHSIMPQLSHTTMPHATSTDSVASPTRSRVRGSMYRAAGTARTVAAVSGSRSIRDLHSRPSTRSTRCTGHSRNRTSSTLSFGSAAAMNFPMLPLYESATRGQLPALATRY